VEKNHFTVCVQFVYICFDCLVLVFDARLKQWFFGTIQKEVYMDLYFIFCIMGRSANKKPRLLFQEPVNKIEKAFEFDSHVKIDEILSITDLHTSNMLRKKSMAYMAYFLTKSSCSVIASDGELQFLRRDGVEDSILFKNAVASMFVLSDAMTVSVHASKFKMAEVEANALESCVALCRGVADKDYSIATNSACDSITSAMSEFQQMRKL